MAKGKFGIGKLMSKRDKRLSLSDWPDADDELLHPHSNQFISRPPPLDVRIEAELRQACALVLQDLKPSGYDIEDTRMKSDVLVDDDVRDITNRYVALKTQSKLRKPNPYDDAAAAAAYAATAAAPKDSHSKSVSFAHRQNDSKSSLATAISRLGDPKDPTSVPPISIPPRSAERTMSLNTQSRTRNYAPQNRAMSMTSAVFAPTESPLAPLPTVATESRAELASPPSSASMNASNRPRVSDSTPTSYQSSSVNAGSTGLTSAQITPSSGSQRMSDQATYSKTDGESGAGEWMKQEVEKHIKTQDAAKPAPVAAQLSSHHPPPSQQPPSHPAQDSASPKRSKGFFSSFRSRSKSKASLDRPASRRSAAGAERVNKDAISGPVDILPPPALGAPQLTLQGPPSVSTNFSRPSSSRGITRDGAPQRDVAASAAQGSIPKIDPAFSQSSPAPGPRLNGGPLLTNGTVRGNDIKDKSDEPLSHSRVRAAGDNSRTSSMNSTSRFDILGRANARANLQAAKSPAAASQPTTSTSTAPQRTDASSQASTTHVQDFYRPQARQAAPAPQGVPPANGASSSGLWSSDSSKMVNNPSARNLDRDPRQTGDSFHAATGSVSSRADNRPGTSDSSASRTTLPRDTIPNRTSSRSQSMLQPPLNLDHFARDKTAANDRAFSMNAASRYAQPSHSSVQTEPVDGKLTNGSRSSGIQPIPAWKGTNGTSGLDADQISLRDSDGPTALYASHRPSPSAKPKRGFGRLFSSKKSKGVMYVPPHVQYYAYGLDVQQNEDAEEEEDEDWDKEACAAPVVGFGRGW